MTEGSNPFDPDKQLNEWCDWDTRNIRIPKMDNDYLAKVKRLLTAELFEKQGYGEAWRARGL